MVWCDDKAIEINTSVICGNINHTLEEKFSEFIVVSFNFVCFFIDCCWILFSKYFNPPQFFFHSHFNWLRLHSFFSLISNSLLLSIWVYHIFFLQLFSTWKREKSFFNDIFYRFSQISFSSYHYSHVVDAVFYA